MFLLNYVNDFIGAERQKLVQEAYDRLGKILSKVGVQENLKKAVPPTQVVEFLGVTFDAKKGTMEVSVHRLVELRELLEMWCEKQVYDRTQLEQLIGKLQFVTACVRPGKVFIARLLNKLRGCP